MTYRLYKPKQTGQQLVDKMKQNGITFKYISEEKAAELLELTFAEQKYNGEEM